MQFKVTLLPGGLLISNIVLVAIFGVIASVGNYYKIENIVCEIDLPMNICSECGAYQEFELMQLLSRRSPHDIIAPFTFWLTFSMLRL